ncbi:M55 family metallopeptidase [Streptomyces griseofuscus]|uniref:M55 family metallopeptidase n=1 Tax=Streptomyces griseofuscus TaxID=146922 RepID=UPI0036A26B40
MVDVQPGGRDHGRGRSMMAEDMNAAVRGALAAGAPEILVHDAARSPTRDLRRTAGPSVRPVNRPRGKAGSGCGRGSWHR